MYNIWDAIKDLFTGKLRFANPPIVKARRAECYSCEVRDEKRNVCTACGCYIPLKIKLEKSTCPMEKW